MELLIGLESPGHAGSGGSQRIFCGGGVRAAVSCAPAAIWSIAGSVQPSWPVWLWKDFKRKLNLYLSSCQFGVTLASLGLGAVTAPIVEVLLQKPLTLLGMSPSEQQPLAFAIALTVATALHITAGEQVPKNWAILYGDRLLPVLAGPLIIFTYTFYPIIWLLNAASNALLRLTGVKVDMRGYGGLPHTEEELRALLAQAVTRGTIPKERQQILTSAFDFPELKVRQIMTPRTQVNYLLINQPIGEVLHTVQNNAFTRLPLCDGDIDHVVGMVNMKDLFNHLQLIPGRLRFTGEKTGEGETIAIPDNLPGSAVHVIGAGDIDLRKIKRDVLHVPELMAVPQLLRQFQLTHNHMAIVVDEYEATSGIVTLEDVLEELVGEIEDEFDTAAQDAFVKEGDAFRVSWTVSPCTSCATGSTRRTCPSLRPIPSAVM